MALRTNRAVIEVLRQTFGNAPGLVSVLTGPDHRLEYVNAAVAALFPGREIVGLPLAVAMPEMVAQGLAETLDEVYRSGQPFRGEAVPARFPSDGAEQRYFDVLFHPIVTPAGEVSGIFNQSTEVTSRVVAERALRQSEARFANIFSQTTVGVAQADMEGRFVLVNDRYCEILGRTREELVSLRMQDVTHDDDLPANLEQFRRLAEGGPPFVIEKRYLRPDGSTRWVRNNVSLVRDSEGRPEFVTAISVDITAEKESQLELARYAEKQRLLVHELNHRVKNTLATVQALAAQAARQPSDPEQAYQGFMDRLTALASAHDVLTREQWAEASLEDVVAAATAPFRGERERITFGGPPLRLAPQRAVAMAMALHELGTNATKYGSLSRPEGSVSVTWRVERALVLLWQEVGGPPVQPPSHRGFGSRLLERALASDLGGKVTLEFDPTGLRCVISAPLQVPGGATPAD